MLQRGVAEAVHQTPLQWSGGPVIRICDSVMNSGQPRIEEKLPWQGPSVKLEVAIRRGGVNSKPMPRVLQSVLAQTRPGRQDLPVTQLEPNRVSLMKIKLSP